MPEEHIAPPPEAGPPPEDYSWHNVAADMGEWHPDLQEHARRNLEQRGIQVGQAALDQEETRPIVTNEQASAKEINESLENAHTYVYKIAADPGFHDSCRKNGVDPFEDYEKPSYWAEVASYVGKRVEAEREEKGDSLELRSRELLAATPDYLFKQFALNHRYHLNKADRHHDLTVASEYNHLIRSFALAHHNTRVSHLMEALEGSAALAFEDKGMRQQAAYELKATIRGARHELSFGQILAHTGREFRGSLLEEDLKGVDYVVGENDPHPIRIDVKASTTEIRGMNPEGFYTQGSHGKLIMWSLVHDRDLGDSFFINQELAAKRAGFLNIELNQIESQQPQAV